MTPGGDFALNDPGGWRGLDLAETLGGLAERGLVAGGDYVAEGAERRARLVEALGPAAEHIAVRSPAGVLALRRERRLRLAENKATFSFIYGAQARLVAALGATAEDGDLWTTDDGMRTGKGFLGLAERLTNRMALGRAGVLTAGAAPRPRRNRPSRMQSIGWGSALPEPLGAVRDPRRVGLWTPPGSAAATRRVLAAFKALAATDAAIQLVVLTEQERAPLAPWPEDFGLEGRVTRRVLGDDLDVGLGDLGQLWMHAGGGCAIEPDPRLALAALARGCPIVLDHHTSLAPGIREIGGGLMRDGAWPQQFAEAGREIIADGGLREALTRAGPILVGERFGREAYFERLAEVLTRGVPTG